MPIRASKTSIPSPVQMPGGELASMLRQFLAILPEFERKHAEMKAMHENIHGHIANIKQGPPGPPGLPGRPGFDGATPNIDEIVRLVSQRIPRPKDGKPGMHGKSTTPDEVIQKIIDEKLLKPEHIDGLMGQISSYRNQLSGAHYGRDTLVRGGGDTVTAGSGITITTNTDGKRVITAAIAGTPVYNEVVSGSGTAFTLAHTPLSGTLRLYANGQRLMLTTDYTLSGANVTTLTSWASGTVLADYSF